MNGKQDTRSSLGHFLQNPTNLHGRKGIQTGSWFVQKDHGWFDDEFDTNGSTFAFSSRNTLQQGSSHIGIRTLFQSQFLQHFVGQLDQSLFRSISWQSQLGRKVNGFPGSGGHLKRIILRHKGNVLPNFNLFGIHNVVAQSNFRLNGDPATRCRSTGQNVQQTRLSGTTWPHNGCRFTLGYLSPNTLQQVSILLSIVLSCQDHVNVSPQQSLSFSFGKGIVRTGQHGRLFAD
mmetsp:Transcript_8934/g.21257  ORF Transcript_8934/g.21257 Transcript_8934/m.21257 type:complete len:232 (-) Transcript_8934:479-1174(-)